jgi:hypothetical protein
MKTDGRKRKRIKPPMCTGLHVWGDFIPYHNVGLMKICKHCPARLSVKEFLATKPKIEIKAARPRVEVKTHIDMFAF